MEHPSSSWEIDGTTRLLGVIGDPVAHSLSPAMHNLALQRLGINARYLPFHIRPAELETAVRGFSAQRLMGFNATVPHKEGLVPLMDTLSEEARMVGAVNTVVMDDQGGLHGHNTDGYGLVADLTVRKVAISGAEVVVLGAGGASRGVVAALLRAGAGRVTLVNRTRERAVRLAEELFPHFPAASLEVRPLEAERLPLEECDLLVNTTTQGLHGESLEQVRVERLPAGAAVCDIVYGQTTPLLRAARQRGLTAMDGLGMLIHQGAAAFKLWTGQEMPIQEVEGHLRRILAARAG